MPDFKYKVYPIGDGLFSTYSKIKNEEILATSIFDIGHGRNNNCKNAFLNVHFREYSEARTLVLSHFHLDHFVGLKSVADKSLNIEKFVIPRLPYDKLYSDGVIAFTTIQLFYLSELTGYYETEIIKLLARKNRLTFEIERKVRGEVFIASQTDFKVIWPDPEYVGSLQAVQEGLRDILSISESNTSFKKFYDEVINSSLFDTNILESSSGESSQNNRPFDIILTAGERKTLQRANRRLLSKANDICLAFHDKENRFLSLGDLSDRALDKLFQISFQNPVKCQVILSAHHGTHQTNNNNWINMSCCVLVHSTGDQMDRYFKIAYHLWTTQQHNTYNNGLFDSTLYLRDSNLKKILSKE